MKKTKKVIISQYYYGFVVCEAWDYVTSQVTGNRLRDRGTNIFGGHLGFINELIVWNVYRFREGMALSRAYQSIDEAKAFVKQNQYVEVLV